MSCETSVIGWVVSIVLPALFGANCLAESPTRPKSASQPAAATVPATPAPVPALARFEFHAIKFGSDFNVYLYAADRAKADAAAAAVFARVDALDPVLNDYVPDSEISRLSRLTHDGPMTRPAPVGDDLYDVLRIAQAAAAATDGVFDVTVGPLVQNWRWSKRQQTLPSAERTAAAKAAVGWKLMALDPAGPPAAGQPHAVQLLTAKMRLDAGGLAGGYAADQALALLRRRGITRALIDSSGDLAVGDPPPGKAGWVVAVRDLTSPAKTAGYLEVANCGVSTSGDTYRFVEIDGIRYSHIVDPRTGLGLTRRVGVTTVAHDGVTADWLATTLSVLGPEKGIAFVDQYNKDAAAGATAGRDIGARITSVDEAGRVSVVESDRYRRTEKVIAPASEPH
jgi:thiamine biosynthesis lipoprotein